MSLLHALLAVVVVSYLVFRWKRRRLYELASEIPGKKEFPFIGALYSFSNLQLKDYAKQVLSYCSSDHKISKGWFGPKLVVLTEDADCIHTILNSPHALHKPTVFYKGLYMDEGLLACNGEQYDRHRKILSKSFTVGLIQKFLVTFNNKTKRCVDKLSRHLGGGDFDVFEYVGTCTLESFCTGQLNYDKNLYDSNFMKMIEDCRPFVMKRMFSPWFNFEPLYNMSSLRRTMDYFRKMMHDNIEVIRSANKDSPNTTLKDIVINLMMDPKNNFKAGEFRDEMATFLMAVS
jgi:cytochrome P450